MYDRYGKLRPVGGVARADASTGNSPAEWRIYARSGGSNRCLAGHRRGAAERLAADGWNLIVVARRQERLSELVARLTDAHAVTVQAI
jgi:hypothetical protein